ncbi:hippocampus abundant transcript 1 protein-like [Impatiens glandulifera]|uniref:hippocampus abundant transcript 1 protein-like n=1 Tax=Impatiens glandulifera TaxID=253017 RepID=UPI001FB0D923|nr:hippocampus abundant transcript 1 protein-like [Impatiens glandulifera]
MGNLIHINMSLFLSNFASMMVFPAMMDVTMAALCPGKDECALVIYLSGFQQSIIGLGMVMMMPLIGNLSDIYGRKQMLTFPMTLSIIPLVILACGRTKNFFYAYYVLKILTGMLTGGSLLCLAVAYVADITTEDKRAAALGMVMGFLCASSIGATLVARVLSSDTMFQVAPVISLMALVYMRVFLKESNISNHNEHLERPILTNSGLENCGLSDVESSRKARPSRKIPSIKDFILLVRRSRIFSLAVVITFFNSLAESALEGAAMYFFKARLHYNKDEFANIITILGIVGIVDQIILVPILIRFIGEYKLLSYSLISGFLSTLVYSVAWATWVPYVVATFSIFPIGVTCLTSIMSKQFGRDEQGMAQGCISAISSFASIISPMIFSTLTDLFLSDKAPFDYPGFSILCVGITMLIALIPSLLIEFDASGSSDNVVISNDDCIEP